MLAALKMNQNKTKVLKINEKPSTSIKVENNLVDLYKQGLFLI